MSTPSLADGVNFWQQAALWSDRPHTPTSIFTVAPPWGIASSSYDRPYPPSIHFCWF
ncbi:MAG: hypothetical protein RMY64_36655 [Nostoc sp. DedQUE08]|uniref:hypothetical protein n=1 Tax=Nostoc sp. DedQUE08 TaxID=3075393 RepID=UPI002AD51561|nr:hypothetical protein [Nostoc sp. DedQUE08]MDZ8071093.1 hypothetical protein [Nostoc sp. DedQUE08]